MPLFMAIKPKNVATMTSSRQYYGHVLVFIMVRSWHGGHVFQSRGNILFTELCNERIYPDGWLPQANFLPSHFANHAF